MLIAKCIHLGRSLLLVKASGNKFSFNCPIRKWKNVDLIEGQQSGSVRTNLKSDWLKKNSPIANTFYALWLPGYRLRVYPKVKWDSLHLACNPKRDRKWIFG